MRFLLAGGGTAGHVNPLLALGELLRAEEHQVFVLGTLEGLEARLVPERGFEMLTIAKVPFPRRMTPSTLAFPFRLLAQVFKTLGFIRRHRIDCVVGFGGYVSPPAYLAAFLARRPMVVHEANSRAGFANRLGAKLGAKVAISFPNTNLEGELTGMPLRKEIVDSLGGYDKGQARVELGLDPLAPTLLVTGGSLGAKRINDAILGSLGQLKAAGIQTLHIVGERAGLPDLSEHGYVRMTYCNRMDAAIAAADFAVSRAGASTVAEFTAAGLPAVYIPYPVGNGEQRFNAEHVVAASGAQLVDDSDFTADYVLEQVIPILSHAATLKSLSQASRSVGIPDATQLLRDLIVQTMDTRARD